MAAISTSYPVNLSVDSPARPLHRLTTFFRLLIVIPIAVIFGLISGNNPDIGWTWLYISGGVLFLPIVLMILFRQKYPRWWFDWNIALAKFGARVASYIFLLTDQYPSTDDEQAVHLEIRYPQVAEELNRWLPLVKWLLAVPHYFMLAFLWIGAIFSVTIAWFAILFTGRYPRGLFEYVVGVYRWTLRVAAYAFLLTTDRYPAFDLN